MDIRKVRKLIDLVNTTGIAELEIKEGEESVRITHRVSQAAVSEYQAAPVVMPAPPAPVEAAKAAEAKPEEPHGHTVRSPMVGTVYLSPAPGTKSFVENGQKVKVGDTICLIEAMKMFIQVESDKAGIISACLIDNAHPVEYDQPLFIIEED